MGKDSNFDIVYRGEPRDRIPSGSYVFFQRRKEHGGGIGLVRFTMTGLGLLSRSRYRPGEEWSI
ncbi:UNVERIFIED_ORG: hypothetical protein M2414_002341 [Rahnella aquatilis]|jgi:hypothetical protein|nr:hypothetical protein [Rahnella aquatilis]CAH0245328.1 hypothetical protein SRABI106_02494 [Rahnella aquatilis]